jgi:hypothetical protein
MMKLRDFGRFLIALAAGVALLLLLVLRVTSCAPIKPTVASAPGELAAEPRLRPGIRADCRAEGWAGAARANGGSLAALAWAPFRRPETGWEVYAPLIQREIGTVCGPDTEGFAKAFAGWQGEHGLSATGLMNEADFIALKNGVQTRREFVRFTSLGTCPETADQIAAARIQEGYSGKAVQARPAVLAAYRRMVAAAKAEVPEIAADPRNLTIFSGYRSPSADAARCQIEGNCDGIVRARCSAHRTGLALDMYVGQAPGFGPDSSADPNRLFMSKTPTYLWLVANAHRFGFVNYPFEPWHWEWTGEPP